MAQGLNMGNHIPSPKFCSISPKVYFFHRRALSPHPRSASGSQRPKLGTKKKKKFAAAKTSNSGVPTGV